MSIQRGNEMNVLDKLIVAVIVVGMVFLVVPKANAEIIGWQLQNISETEDGLYYSYVNCIIHGHV